MQAPASKMELAQRIGGAQGVNVLVDAAMSPCNAGFAETVSSTTAIVWVHTQ